MICARVGCVKVAQAYISLMTRLSRDITDQIFQVTWQDHLIKGSCNFMGGSSSLCIPTLPSSVTIGTVVVDI